MARVERPESVGHPYLLFCRVAAATLFPPHRAHRGRQRADGVRGYRFAISFLNEVRLQAKGRAGGSAARLKFPSRDMPTPRAPPNVTRERRLYMASASCSAAARGTSGRARRSAIAKRFVSAATVLFTGSVVARSGYGRR